MGADRELTELYKLNTQRDIVVFKSSSGISFLTGLHTSGLGGLDTGNIKLMYEELNTILTQMEACLNSRLLAPMITADGDDVEVLTPGHFLVGHPTCIFPDKDQTDRPLHILR